jgi:hypothetical protein
MFGTPENGLTINVYFKLYAIDKNGDGSVMIDDLTIDGNLAISIHVIDRWK